MKRLIICSLAACAPSVPEQPSFQQDVLPILAANCVRCHGVPQIGGAPRDFRLDMFGDTVDGATTVLSGAAAYAIIVGARVDGDNPMPPRFPLDDYQIETLKRWAANPTRGEPRRGNYPPVVSVLDAVESISEEGFENRIDMTVTIRVDDEDRDLVGGWWRVDDRFIGPIHSGTNVVTWRGATPGEFRVNGFVDDGAAQTTFDAGTIRVVAP